MMKLTLITTFALAVLASLAVALLGACGPDPTPTPTLLPIGPAPLATPELLSTTREPPSTFTPSPGPPPTDVPVPTVLPSPFTPTPGGQYMPLTGREWYEAGLDYADTLTDIALMPSCEILHRLSRDLSDDNIRAEYYRGNFRGLRDRLKDVFGQEGLEMVVLEGRMTANAWFLEMLFAGAPMQGYPDTWPDVDWFGLRLGISDGQIRFCDRWEKGTPTPTPSYGP